jgi:hypothetical protein
LNTKEQGVREVQGILQVQPSLNAHLPVAVS